MSLLWMVRPVHPETIKLSGTKFRQIAMPDKIATLSQFDALNFALSLRVEQTQLDLFGMLGKNSKIHTFPSQ